MTGQEYEEILSLSPFKFLEYIQSRFHVTAPSGFNTLKDITGVANVLMEITEKKELLNGLAAYVKIKTRELKREGDKLAYEDMVDRKEAIECTLDSLKDKYNAISRSVTIVLSTEGQR